MNKYLFYSIVFFFTFFSCKKNEKKVINLNHLGSNIKDCTSANVDKIIEKKAKGEAKIFPDSTVNNKLILSNSESLKKFHINKIIRLERIRETPVVVFTNKNELEYLIAYQYEGGTENSFNCFEFGFLKDDKSLFKVPKFVTSELKFYTESKISLNMNFDDIINIKGVNYVTEVNNNITIITYKNEDYNESSFLKRYNMPSYFMEFTLRDNKLIRIKYGFDQP